MPAGDGDANTSNDDEKYTTTESERSESEPPYSGPSLAEKIPQDLRAVIIDFYVPNIPLAVLVPTALANLTEDGDVEALEDAKETLICTTTDPLSRTCKDLHSEYATNLWAKVLYCKVPQLVVHVLDFDFSLAISELFSQFDDTSRSYFNSLRRVIHIGLTITRNFALLPNENGLDKWLQWRKQEENAGRKVKVDYQITLQTTQGEEELESLRQFLLLFDPEGNEGGEVGGIMRRMKNFYENVYAGRRKSVEEVEMEDEEGPAQDDDGVEDDDARGDSDGSVDDAVSVDDDVVEDDILVQDNFDLDHDDLVESNESDGSDHDSLEDY